jgi:response regulator of citrate/malate metabolism
MNFDLLIVDDDLNYQFIHKLITKKSGFHSNPKCFGSGKEAIDYLEKNKSSDENILIFLDLYMQEIDGWGVADFVEFLNQPQRIKIFIISSSVNLADKQKAIKYTCIVEYIEKPLELDYLESIKDIYFF